MYKVACAWTWQLTYEKTKNLRCELVSVTDGLTHIDIFQRSGPDKLRWSRGEFNWCVMKVAAYHIDDWEHDDEEIQAIPGVAQIGVFLHNEAHDEYLGQSFRDEQPGRDHVHIGDDQLQPTLFRHSTVIHREQNGTTEKVIEERRGYKRRQKRL